MVRYVDLSVLLTFDVFHNFGQLIHDLLNFNEKFFISFSPSKKIGPMKRLINRTLLDGGLRIGKNGTDFNILSQKNMS